MINNEGVGYSIPSAPMQFMKVPPHHRGDVVLQNLMMPVNNSQPFEFQHTFAPKQELNEETKVSVKTEQKKKRPVALPACVNCRRSKVKCTGGIPCKRCLRLKTESTCVRCQPRKRGRKRKAAKSNASDTTWSTASKSKLQKSSASGLPSRSDQDLEMDVVERLAGFSSQFNIWQSAVNGVDVCRQRLVYFCAYLKLNMLGRLSGNESKVVKKLASSLQQKVDSYLQTIPHSDMALYHQLMGKTVSGANQMDLEDDDFKLDVEREVYSNMPVGTWIVDLKKGFMSPSAQSPWVNARACQILGYTQDELTGILSDHDKYARLIHHSSFGPLSSSFWNAVSTGKGSYTNKCRFIHKTGRVLDLMATFWIHYRDGLPHLMTVFLQHRDEEKAVANKLPVTTPSTTTTATLDLMLPPMNDSMVMDIDSAPLKQESPTMMGYMSDDLDFGNSSVGSSPTLQGTDIDSQFSQHSPSSVDMVEFPFSTDLSLSMFDDMDQTMSFE